MKKLISNYTFDASQKKIFFDDYQSIDLESLLLITNVTDNIIIYNFADPTKGAGVSGNSVTLSYDTASMSDTDALQIFYEDGLSAASDNSVQVIGDVALTLKRIAKNMESLQVVDSLQRQRVVVETLANMTTLGQCNAVNGLGGVDPKQLMIDLARTAYNAGIRNNLTFS